MATCGAEQSADAPLQQNWIRRNFTHEAYPSERRLQPGVFSFAMTILYPHNVKVGFKFFIIKSITDEYNSLFGIFRYISINFVCANGLQMHLLVSFMKGVSWAHNADAILRLSLSGSWRFLVEDDAHMIFDLSRLDCPQGSRKLKIREQRDAKERASLSNRLKQALEVGRRVLTHGVTLSERIKKQFSYPTILSTANFRAS